MRRAGSRRVVLVGTAVSAATLVLAAGRTWVTAHPGLSTAPPVVRVAGTELAPGALSLALVVAAAGIVLLTAGRWARLLGAALLVLGGAGELAGAVSVLAAPARAVLPAVAQASGITPAGLRPPPVSVSAWPWVALLAGGVAMAAGLLAAVRSHRWPALGRRYEVATAARGADSIDRPTADRPAHPARDRAAGPGAEPRTDERATERAHERATERATERASEPAELSRRRTRDAAMDAWDALSRGEDPTR